MSSTLILFSIKLFRILSNLSYEGKESVSFWLKFNSAEGSRFKIFSGIAFLKEFLYIESLYMSVLYKSFNGEKLPDMSP